GVVAGTKRKPPIREIRAVLWVEEELHGVRYVVSADDGKCVPSHLIEASTEPVPALVSCVLVDVHVGCSAGYLRHLPFRPIGIRTRHDKLDRVRSAAGRASLAARAAAGAAGRATAGSAERAATTATCRVAATSPDRATTDGTTNNAAATTTTTTIDHASVLEMALVGYELQRSRIEA